MKKPILFLVFAFLCAATLVRAEDVTVTLPTKAVAYFQALADEQGGGMTWQQAFQKWTQSRLKSDFSAWIDQQFLKAVTAGDTNKMLQFIPAKNKLP